MSVMTGTCGRFAWLRRMPVALVFAYGGAIAIAALSIVATAFDLWSWRRDTTLLTLLAGSWFAIDVLVVAGLVELRRRHPVRGAHVALAAATVMLVAHLGLLVFEVVSVMSGDGDGSDAWRASSVLGLVLAVVLAVGVGMAIGKRRWIALGTVVAIATHPLWFVHQYLSDTLELRAYVAVERGLELLSALSLFAMISIACRYVSAAPIEPSRGLRPITTALRGKAIVAIVLAGSTLVVEGLVVGRQTLGVLQVVVVLATVAGFGCLVVFAIGALRASHGGGLLGTLFVTSATAVLAVAGTQQFRILDTVVRYFMRDRSMGIVFPGEHPTFMDALSAQFLVAAAIVIALVATAIAARRRGLDELRARTMVVACTVTGMMLAAFAAEGAIVHDATLTNSSIAIIVGATALIATASLLAARIARRAAEAFDGALAVPAATIVRR